jgi:uracil-DNA glycosylase
LQARPTAALILLGNVANEIDPLIPLSETKKLYAEHPYNITFIHNRAIIDFFKPLHLLKRQKALEMGNVQQ